ncbi:phenylalanine--tRNA ligase subunit alpha [Buchnera aphidicola (Pemphigus obesinymphae)]|uniref:phenylalanine--tRNA ligase subunit alpha n=1 Tax=Buchnera aphidicola TaxID=9 RepID=UPI0022380F70|nr:phenylalanine--tRNA ligase subunit alpha [Buchnera aphidicola]MCW5196815.1 phenylalanine--tRNA ligase subunit alpha [Buchnera aphidicola (Pemphigus obesinymphae)]
MIIDPQALINLVEIDLKKIKNMKELNKVKVKYLGKKSFLSKEFFNLRNFVLKEKIKYSAILNQLKLDIQSKISVYKKKIIFFSLEKKINKEKIDISLSGRRVENGAMHPITIIINNIERFFLNLGFKSITGPEIEDEYHNFSALNISHNHPSRSNKDTFWFDINRLLRTQTSSMQIRIMEHEKPPIKIIVPGKVYRNDYDVTHTPMFHQIEGLIVDKNVSFSNLKWIIQELLSIFFGKHVQTRFRTSYFPFTTPSAEIDIMGKDNQWIEVLGCGMVHPKVLSNVNINYKEYKGCAFGLGVERIAMLYYGIPDLRYFFENDLNFLKQFK